METVPYVPLVVHGDQLEHLGAAGGVVSRRDDRVAKRGEGEVAGALAQGEALDAGAVAVGDVGREPPAEGGVGGAVKGAVGCLYTDQLTQGRGEVCDLGGERESGRGGGGERGGGRAGGRGGGGRESAGEVVGERGGKAR